ncbi:FliM/FliN family flagellar motor switch protein [Desulfotalea psychrophila]|nr:FliM/FliN family flagellar motor switch protein [Desulfocapsa sp.]MBN4071740.1 FliM/FliN family flagellar motor switch protein [Desulfotalea psychrophila]
MEAILNREQIAELLEGIKSGRVSTDLQGDDSTASSVNFSPLNLFDMSDSADTQQRIPNLDIILDNFASRFGITLTNQLQKTVTVTRTEINSSSFQEYMMSQKDAGAFGVLGMAPLKSGALMVLDSGLCYSLIEIMLGASSEISPLLLDRKPTSIELNVLKSIMLTACGDIDKSLEQITEIESSIVKVESNSRLVSIAEPDAEILAGRFQLKVGSISGTFDLVFPVVTLDPLREQLRDLLTVKTVRQSGWHDLLIEEINKMSTTVVAQSGTITMPVRKVMKLKKGDVLSIDYDPNSPLKILVEDNLKFFAIPGTIKGKKAINLTGIYGQGE